MKEYGIVSYVTWCIIGGLALGGFLIAERHGYQWDWQKGTMLGHVTRAYGTVKLKDRQRLVTDKAILEAVRIGDQIQTSEESAAEVLFFGGSTLRIAKESLVRFEDYGSDVALRVIMGHAYFELPTETSAYPNQFIYRGIESPAFHLPQGKKLVLALSAVYEQGRGVRLQMIDEKYSDLKNLAISPWLVPPVDDLRKDVTAHWRQAKARRTRTPIVVSPKNEAYIDIERNDESVFQWKQPSAPRGELVSGYEIVVRPAFGYDVDEGARKRQLIGAGSNRSKIGNVGGGGVFLWSVRAITANGERGPASAPQWIELKFPKILVAPTVLKPKVQ